MHINRLLIIFTYSTAFTTAIERGVHTRFERGYHYCGDGEQYSNTGKDCLTCKNYKNTTCPLIKEEKCYCLDGFVKDSQDRCINKTDCSKACEAHEHYTDTAACEYTCGGTDFKQWSSQCLTRGGCVCEKGYVRCLEKNSCVPQGQCYPVCGPNEVVSYNRCEPYCKNQTVTIDEPCTMLVSCEARCICKVDEYIRGEENGQCIHSSDCSPPVSIYNNSTVP